jgi:beta-mannosidase
MSAMTTIDLSGTWEFRAADSDGTLPAEYSRAATWMPATVPGTVHTDLMAGGVIPDPFFRMNENDVQWVEGQSWIYRRTFTVPASVTKETVVRLNAGGLDTYARIEINGKKVGESANMFIGHQFDAKKALRPGDNTIEIRFDSPVKRAKRLEAANGALRVVLEPHRAYVRKAQYSFGWDWGPKLTTSGIWQGVSIEAFSGPRLRDPFIRVLSVNAKKAVMRLSVEIEGRVRKGTRLGIAIEGGDGPIAKRVLLRGKSVSVTLAIPRPRLWWPNGQGDQPMYAASLTLLSGDDTIQSLVVPFAVRTVALLRDKDAQGTSFIFVVNGRKIFCKGADWIPADNFLPRIPDSRYETLLQMAKDAHMNMVRVWGGGIYEKDLFYELCDRHGLMVWQDFMFACGEYPDRPWFQREVAVEAERTIKRLRNHPSIVLWCGNNECEWLFCTENPDKGPDSMRGAKIFRDLLPAACASHDGSRPYWRSSPFGVGFPNDEGNGNHHQWTVWSAWKDFAEYELDNARFVSEFGFQATANLATMEACSVPADRMIQSRVMEHHNKQVEGTERLMRFMAAHYRVETGFSRFLYLSQLVQAAALKRAVEHWRRRKYATAGSLFWQLNDCWPVSSWAVIDSALRPKAAYFYSKRFFAPVLASFRRSNSGIGVWITNDHPTAVKGTLSVTRRTVEGGIESIHEQQLTIPKDSSREIVCIAESRLDSLRRDSEYLHAGLEIDGVLAAENRFFFEEPKHMNLSGERPKAEVREDGTGRFVVRLSAKQLARDVQVAIEGEDALFGDNYVDIDAGMVKEIRFQSGLRLADLVKSIHIEWLK